MFGISTKLKTILFKVKWRKLNQHNYTTPMNLFDPDKVKVGRKTYGELRVNLGTNPKRTVQIGSFCSIAPNVNFIINPHNYRFFSSWGWQIYEYNERNYDWEKKTGIIVEDDVWIGHGATILGGAILRQGCVVGANTVVSGEVPPYAIFAGGRIIKYRFDPEVCERLNQIDYSKVDAAKIQEIKGWHRIEITQENVEELMRIMPLKRGGQ